MSVYCRSIRTGMIANAPCPDCGHVLAVHKYGHLATPSEWDNERDNGTRYSCDLCELRAELLAREMRSIR